MSHIKKNPALTIVTICLNSEQTIAGTIESIKRQKTNEVEYIVIDGGSHDKTQEIVQSYGNVIDVFVTEPDRGISDAFNKGIARSSGEIIGLLNADDQLLPGAISKIFQWFHEKSETQVVHGDILLYNKKQFVKRINPSRFWWIPWRLVLFNHPATFVRKSIYEQWGGYRTDYCIAMDIERFAFWGKNKVKITHLSEPLVRMAAGGLSGRSRFVGVRERKKALLDHGYNRLMVEVQYIIGLLLEWFLSLRTTENRRP